MLSAMVVSSSRPQHLLEQAAASSRIGRLKSNYRALGDAVSGEVGTTIAGKHAAVIAGDARRAP